MQPTMLRSRWPLMLAACVGIVPALRAQSSVDQVEALIRSRQYNQAFSAAQSALRRSPRDARLWTLEGIAGSLSGRTPDASKAFEQALKLAPNDPAALRGESQIFFQAGDGRAQPLLERILQQDPRDQTARVMLATLQEKQGDCSAAIENFSLSADATQSQPASLESWGRCLMQTHQPEQAIPVFRRLAALRPDQTWAQYDLAVALVDAKQSAAALNVLEPLLTQNQTDPDVLSLASDADEATGNTPKAVALLRQAIVLNPGNSAYYVAFASLCLNHDAFQVGIDMIDVGLKHISADPSLYISRGLLYAQLAQYDKAEADFQTAERLDSAQSLSSFASDLTALQQNQSGTALENIRAQLKVHPQSPLLNYLLAKLLWSQGNQTDSAAAAESLQHAQLAVQLQPDMVEARNLMADLYIAAGHDDLAIEQSRLALRNDPSDQTAVYHLIVALRHTPPGPARDEIPSLVKRLSELQQRSLQQETERKRYSLVEQKAAPAH